MIRAIAQNYFTQAIHDQFQTGRQGAFGCSDTTAANIRQLMRMVVNDAKSGDAQTRIYAEYPDTVTCPFIKLVFKYCGGINGLHIIETLQCIQQFLHFDCIIAS